MIKRLRGFRDITGEEAQKFRIIEEVSRKYLELLGYSEVRIPILEKTELFVRSIGDSTDIVRKEMFTFIDASGDSVSLRPEATAGMVRAYIEGNFYAKERITKVFTIGSMFRHERPQKGRFREFNQLDVEVFGSYGPLIDAELIWLITLILGELKIKDFRIEINTLGCSVCREKYKKLFSEFVNERLTCLCEDCKERAKKNPLRIFDCKKPECHSATQDAPLLFESLCEECMAHFGKFKELLAGFGIQTIHNNRLVRGLDYYTRTVFEVTSERLGAQKAFIAGGRYDNLVREMGGPNIPGIGFALGLERLSLILETYPKKEVPKVFIAYLGEEAKKRLFGIVKQLLDKNIPVYYELDDRSLKSQMRYANSLSVDYVVIIGEEEVKNGVVILRDMKNGTQNTYGIDFTQALAEILKSSPMR